MAEADHEAGRVVGRTAGGGGAWGDGEAEGGREVGRTADREADVARRTDEGGEAVCWLHLVCAGCGAIAEQEPPPEHCARCGADLAVD